MPLMPSALRPQPASAGDFIPEKISLNSRRGRRFDRGQGSDAIGDAKRCDADEVKNPHASEASHASGFSASVVFHEEGELFDEIDYLYPHDYEDEGGKISPGTHNNSSATFSDRPGSDGISVSRPHSCCSSRSTRSFTSSLLQSLRNSKLSDRIPTDYDSLVRSSNDGTLSQIIARIEDRYKASAAPRASGESDAIVGKSDNNLTLENLTCERESIVGGRKISEMTFEEQRKLMAPERSNSSLIVDTNGKSKLDRKVCPYSPFPPSENESGNIIVSSVDWSSLMKSCKRAKNAFRDADSGQMVVKNMFLTHLGALKTVLNVYAKKDYNPGDCHSANSCDLEEIKARTTETKRALRFAISCLAPPRVGEELKESSESGGLGIGDMVERFRVERCHRRELQDMAVKGSEDREICQQRGQHHISGLQTPLAEIIFYWNPFPGGDEVCCGDVISSIENERQTVRILAGRLLCNLVTDNPLAAEIVLHDLPFSPITDQIQSRAIGSLTGSSERVDEAAIITHGLMSWSGLVSSAAKVTDGGRGKNISQNREALAAVSAALHNLMTSLETRESLLEFDDEIKRREHLKHHREVSHEDDAHTNETLGQKFAKPIDVGFEVASNGPLVSIMLRNLLPTNTKLMQCQVERDRNVAGYDISDSATEWISLIFERLASRGLLPQMLRSAGGTLSESVTPEQVILVSCIRQAVDDYHALTPAGKSGGFGRRRLSIAAKTQGMAVTTRPHPLWGRTGSRVVSERDSRSTAPVLLSLANEVEEARLRAEYLRERKPLYEGEQKCTNRIIHDICEILAQSLGKHVPSSIGGAGNMGDRQCYLADARSVIGRETSLISSCCKDLACILDTAFARNSGRKTRELVLSSHEQQTSVAMVRLIGNLIYQCRYNQDILRLTPIPVVVVAENDPAKAFFADTNVKSGGPAERTGLHVVLSATSLAPACFTLREWCIVAIRNAVENCPANAEAVRTLEANQVLNNTPELLRIGLKVELDANGKIQVMRRD